MSIEVGTFNPPPPPTAPEIQDQTVTAIENKPVEINLSDQSGSGPGEPGGPHIVLEDPGAAAAKSQHNNPSLFGLKATALTVDGGWTFFNDCAIGTPCPDGPFTFSIASGGACVNVTDAFLKSDEYTVSDNGQTLGATSTGVPDDGVSETDADLAFADPDYSSGTFVVGSGGHSIDVTRNAGLPGLAAAYIRVDSPGTAYCAAFTNLTATSFSAPTAAELGETIGGQIQVTVTNTGTVDIAAGTSSAIGFYISTDSVVTTSDTLLIGGRENLASSAPSGLAVGASISGFLFAGASVNTVSPEGDVFIGVVVDEFDSILESDETDNVASQAIRIGPPTPDLVVSSLTHTPVTPDSNDQIELTAVVENVGNGSAAASALCFEIGGESCATDPDDTLFDVPSLAPGATFEVLRILVCRPVPSRRRRSPTSKAWWTNRSRPTTRRPIPS